jgi:predicted outer membrane protein
MFKAFGTQLVPVAIVMLILSNTTWAAAVRQVPDPSTFLERGIEMNHAVIELTDLGINKAEDERVRHLVKIMADRQTQVLQRLDSLRPNNPVRGIAYDGVDRNVVTPEHQRALERLSLLAGSEFDREFIDEILYEYRRIIRLFEQEAGIPTVHQTKLRRTIPPAPGEMADLARDLLPSLRQQLSDTEAIQKALQHH